jgi:hypothetical protein
MGPIHRLERKEDTVNAKRTRPFARAARALLCLFLLAGLVPFVGGCGTQEGETVMTGGPETKDNVGKAPRTGTYKLYTAMSPNPTLTIKLNEGDPLGFRKAEDGHIDAVYGSQTYALGKGTTQAYWKVQK